jgi:hypothetical protein
MGSPLIKRTAWAAIATGAVWIVILAQPAEGAPFIALSRV